MGVQARKQSKRHTTSPKVPPRWREFMSQLQQRRISLGLTTTEVSAKLDIDRKSLSHWENATRSVHPHDLVLWLELLGLDLTDLLK